MYRCLALARAPVPSEGGRLRRPAHPRRPIRRRRRTIRRGGPGALSPDGRRGCSRRLRDAPHAPPGRLVPDHGGPHCPRPRGLRGDEAGVRGVRPRPPPRLGAGGNGSPGRRAGKRPRPGGDERDLARDPGPVVLVRGTRSLPRASRRRRSERRASRSYSRIRSGRWGSSSAPISCASWSRSSTREVASTRTRSWAATERTSSNAHGGSSSWAGTSSTGCASPGAPQQLRGGSRRDRRAVRTGQGVRRGRRVGADGDFAALKAAGRPPAPARRGARQYSSGSYQPGRRKSSLNFKGAVTISRQPPSGSTSTVARTTGLPTRAGSTGPPTRVPTRARSSGRRSPSGLGRLGSSRALSRRDGVGGRSPASQGSGDRGGCGCDCDCDHRCRHRCERGVGRQFCQAPATPRDHGHSADDDRGDYDDGYPAVVGDGDCSGEWRPQRRRQRAAVKTLQQALKQLGLYDGAVDGDFGPGRRTRWSRSRTTTT